MLTDLDLNVDAPEKIVDVLRNAASTFRDAELELQAAWQDRNAGRVWREIAKALEKAANQCDKAVDRYV